MSKIRLTERQVSMLQKISDKSRKNVLKINENQFDRLFGDNSEESTKKEINLLEFAQELIVFIKNMISNHKMANYSSYWKELGIPRRKLFQIAKNAGLLNLEDGDDGVSIYKTPKHGFRKAIKGIHKEISESGGWYPAGAEHDPNAPWNEPDYDVVDEEKPLEPKSEILKLVYFNDAEDDIAIFKGNKNYYAIMGIALDGDELDKYQETDTVDDNTIYNYVNYGLENNLIDIKTGWDELNYGELVELDREVLNKLIRIYGLNDFVNGLPETTTAGSSGAYVGSSPFGGNKPRLSPEDEMSNIIEDDIVIDETTSTVSGGGGAFGSMDTSQTAPEIIVPLGRDIDKDRNGIPQKGGSGVVKRNYASMSESIKPGQIYKNGVGRARIEKVDFKTLTVRRWGDIAADTIKISKKDLSGWTLIENVTNRLKITETQLAKLVESDNMKDTAYPNGEMISFDDCTKLNNNTVAQDGGCSVGAVDNVVTTSKTSDSVVSEALKLQHNEQDKMLVVLSDNPTPRGASRETFASKNILKKSGFRWNGTHWIISDDKLDIAKTALTNVNKVEYFVDKLENLEKILASASGSKNLVSAKLDQYIKDIANATDEAAASAEIRRFLTFFAKFRQYSFHNSILIYIQKPDAKKVAGYRKWQEVDRQVQKGAKHIVILAPIFGNKSDDNDDGLNIDPLSGKKREVKKTPIGYRPVKVFDVSDTKATTPNGEIPKEPKWWGGNEPSEVADMLYHNLTEVAKTMGIKTTTTDAKGGEKGYSAGDHINLTSDVKGAGRASTMAHEMAHELMHWKSKSMFYIGDKERMDKALVEMQAETVSYVVLKHYGISVRHHATYLALWGSNGDKIRKYLKLIADVADFIIREVDKVAKHSTDTVMTSESINGILKEIGF